ncbi:Hsp20/alpha crystallin family protein [Euzebya sp.]|uniref:Hsp20/alpha crystallin family protein n=1 Tax=Euzebya sp. TaxID=1971409 RepID=UPI0035146EDB
MALVRFDPFAELAALQRELTRSTTDDAVAPAVDIIRTDEAFLVRMDVPGVAQDSVDVTLEDGRLMISAERPEDPKAEGATWVRRERRHGAFARSFTMPDGVDPDMITAHLENGVLEVRVPHAPERKPRQIPVSITA